LNCRLVSPETWEHARQALVLFFAHRHGAANAEDLAQRTLMKILSRDDYEFAKEEDFLKVCYGFASLINRERYRETLKHSAVPLEFEPESGGLGTRGLRETEMKVFLDEVLRAGKERLGHRDWQILQKAVSADAKTLAVEFDLGDANNARVHLHRLRRKLAEITGWRKSSL